MTTTRIKDLDVIKARLFDAEEQIKILTHKNGIMAKALWDIGMRAKPIMTAMEVDMARVAAKALLEVGEK